MLFPIPQKDDYYVLDILDVPGRYLMNAVRTGRRK